MRAVIRTHDANLGKTLFRREWRRKSARLSARADSTLACERRDRPACWHSLISLRVYGHSHTFRVMPVPRSAESRRIKEKKERKEGKKKENICKRPACVSRAYLPATYPLNSPVIAETFTRLREAISLESERGCRRGIRLPRESSESGKPLEESA